MSKIKDISAKEIRDSRGNSTLEVTVRTEKTKASFSVPSGASTGIHEALELRDKDGGMKTAIDKIERKINSTLFNFEVSDQKKIDEKLIQLDGTKNKSNLGGNSILGVSVACAKASAKEKEIELYEYLRSLEDIKPSQKKPYLYLNLINGGKHAKSGTSFQEHIIIPKTLDPKEGYEIGKKIQKELARVIRKEKKVLRLKKGDEGGFIVNTENPIESFNLINKAIEKLGTNIQIDIGADIAATSFYKHGKYIIGNKNIDTNELLNVYDQIIREEKLISIEDPFNEEDFGAFSKILEKYPNALIIGDDLTTTNKERLKKAIERKSINAVIIKPNQIGTLTETLETMKFARDNNIHCIVSHRSGETMDNFIADLAYAFGVYGLKSGAPNQDERDVKYERLIEISEKNKSSRTQIVATIGPSSKTKEIIKEMAENGMDVARLNFSWGYHEEMTDFTKMVRESAKELEKNIPIIQDLSGPREITEDGHHFDDDATSVITEKDKKDLEWAKENKPEYIALSFVSSAKDILELKELLREMNIEAKIIAKIERQIALDNIDEILEVTDAIMVARGDLGNEVPLEKIPFVQEELIKKANKAKKPVIVATEMMPSMIENNIPTRSDVTDVTNAVLTNTDAIMLSNETATGNNPKEVIEMMEKIAVEAEKHNKHKSVNLL